MSQNIRDGYRSCQTEDLEKADKEAVIVLQIESREGIRKIDEILSVEGVDVVVIGRGDLARDMGLPCQQNHPSGSRIIEVDGILFGGKGKYSLFCW